MNAYVVCKESYFPNSGYYKRRELGAKSYPRKDHNLTEYTLNMY